MWRASLLLLVAVGQLWASPEPGVLPVYIEENHAGSFGWIASNVDLDEPHTLVLVDAHSDATAVARSDVLREGLRRVGSQEERAEHIANWRRRGWIQAFNWIEPLMPRPIEQVVWIPRWNLSADESQKWRREAGESVDGRTEFEVRASGELASRWKVVAGQEFEQWQPGNLPVLASIDLDFFAGMTPSDATERFRRIWSRLLELPRLRGITFAISRPWQRDDAEAFRLLHLALEEVRLVRGARVTFEPFAPAGPDASLRAQEFPDGKPPTLRIEDAPPELSSFFALHGERFTVGIEVERWKQLCAQWQETAGGWTIRPDEGEVSTDGIFRIDEKKLGTLRVSCPGSAMAPGRVRWFALHPAADCYNLLPDIHLGKGFTRGTGPWVRDRRTFLVETEDGALAAKTWKRLLDPKTGWGRVRIEAEVETEGGWQPTPTVELRVTSGDDFRAGLSEQFGMSYVFGVGFYRERDTDGADTGIGNDCANFLIHAWRCTGRVLPWSNPAGLRKRLRTIVEHADAQTRVPLAATDIHRGIAIDFGSHVAALWEDREPLSELDPSDIVVHHLGGFPERTTLGALATDRPRFAVRTLPEDTVCRLAICGDVVLADVSENAVLRLSEHLRGADLAVANMEGVPAQDAERVPSRYNFAFSTERLSWLKSAGITGVGMANNHAGDAGVRGIGNARELVAGAALAAFGIGGDSKAAVQPWLVERNGVRFAFFAVSCVEALPAESDRPGVAVLSEHAPLLEHALREAKAEGRTVIVLAHWGKEYSKSVTAEQRQWARWLIDRGADLVAGAHPHVTQSCDTWRGRAVMYSLGNAVFPDSLRGSDDGAVLEVGINGSGEIVSARQIAIPR